MEPLFSHINSKSKPFLRSKDYTVSHETFDLYHHSELDMLITFPQPEINDLSSYYESESYISHTDAKKSLTDKLYQLVKTYTISNKVKLLNTLIGCALSEKKVLDVGCGTGDFLVACQQRNWNVVGVEPNPKARLLAHDKLNITIYNSIFDLKENQFDCITLWHVLEHIPDLESYIQELKKLLKPNGKLIIAVPNFKSYDANYYGTFWAAYDVPRHLWHFSKTAIQQLFGKENLELIKIQPMYFDSFYVSLLSEKYKTGSSSFFKAFYRGFISNLKAIKSKEYSSLIYILQKAN